MEVKLFPGLAGSKWCFGSSEPISSCREREVGRPRQHSHHFIDGLQGAGKLAQEVECFPLFAVDSVGGRCKEVPNLKLGRWYLY